MTSEFVFFSSNPSLNHIKIEKCLLPIATNTNIHSTVQRAKDRRQKFHFCRLPFDVRPRNVKLNLSIAKTMTSNGKLACSAGVFVLELAVVSSPPYWLEQSRWGGGGGKRYFSFQPNSHSLGRIFVSLQASSEFESEMALA